jgi:AMP-binding enzyme
MILGDRPHASSTDRASGHATLDDMFRRALERAPDALALADPPDRSDFTDGAPRRLTYAQADRAIGALAERLRGFGLATDAVVAVQLPNTVESVVALLGVLRAGLIAAPLPLLWRQADAVEALGRVGARALVATRRVGDVDFADLAVHVAAETFAIRFVCAFGAALPDGIAPLDDVFADAATQPLPAIERLGAPADHVAVVTFDVSADGLVPVARSHAELIAGGLGVQLEARIEAGANILGTLAIGSFAGLATTLVPWLMTGGTLALHQPFTPDAFAAQCSERSVAVLPGALASRLAEAGLIRESLQTILAVWRAPERLAASPAWPGGPALVDVSVFGEVGLVAVRRSAGGEPSALPVGRTALPRDAPDPSFLLDVTRTPGGTLALSGSMVPRAPFPLGAERGEAPRLKLAGGGIDTGYACKVDRDKNLVIDGPPAGIVSVGGYRFLLRTLQDLVGEIEDGSMLAALPDMLAGHRLAGGGIDRDAIRAALIAQGANPLLVAAFRPRPSSGRASAA